jgi:hypothetical protein
LNLLDFAFHWLPAFVGMTKETIPAVIPVEVCVRIQIYAQFLTVMPDLIRHPAEESVEKELDSGSSPE